MTIPRGASTRFALPSPSFGASSTGTAWISRRRGMRSLRPAKRPRDCRSTSPQTCCFPSARAGHRDGGSVAGGQRSRCLLGVPVRGEAGRSRDSAQPGQRAHPGPAAVRAPRFRPDRHRAGDSRRLVDAQVLPDPRLAHPIRLPPPGPLQRFRRIASVRAELVPGPVPSIAAHVEESRSLHLCSQLSAASKASREAELPERWLTRVGEVIDVTSKGEASGK